jgi:protein-S-isoprenylcysteine O-methyltransferase Ste14
MFLAVASVAGFAAMAGGIVVLIMARSVFGDGVVPVAVQLFAFGLMVWARMAFGRRSFHPAANPTKGGLVTSGPYRHIRHPIYTAVICFTWAGVLSHLSPLSVLVGVCVAAGAGLRMYAEEVFLVERYPEYAEYAHRTKRMIPHVF